MTEVSS